MPEQLLFAAAASFEAAREVALFPAGHRLHRLHGHSFLATLRAGLPHGWGRHPGDEVCSLQARLARCVAALDYRLLNEELEHPTDENLARWVRSRLDLPGIEQIGIQSTRHHGVYLDHDARMHVWRRYRFEAAHRLPSVPAGHKCARMHGHGFDVILHGSVPRDSRDLGLGDGCLDRCWAPLQATLHQACLNDIAGLENPTSELIASWIWDRLKPALPELSWVTVYETASCGAHYDGRRYRIWKEISLDCALRFERVPESDPRRHIHGHTYVLRLHLNASLDQTRGWTMDFGDVKETFAPVFSRLDHRALYETEGLEDNDCASIVRWIRSEAAPLLPQLDRIDLYETHGCGAILAWGDDRLALPV